MAQWRKDAPSNKILFAVTCFLLSGCTEYSYKILPLDSAINTDHPMSNVRISGFIRASGGRLELYPDKASRDATDISRCIPIVSTARQARTLVKSYSTKSASLLGDINVNPMTVYPAQMYDVKIEGRRWYGTSCRTRAILFLRSIDPTP